jgi:hypothetical protein
MRRNVCGVGMKAGRERCSDLRVARAQVIYKQNLVLFNPAAMRASKAAQHLRGHLLGDLENL